MNSNVTTNQQAKPAQLAERGQARAARLVAPLALRAVVASGVRTAHYLFSSVYRW